MGWLGPFQLTEKISDKMGLGVLRGRLLPAGKAVIWKCPLTKAVSDADASKLRLELEILKHLEGHGAPRLLAVAGERLITGDFGGSDLTALILGARLSLSERMTLAIGMSRALAKVHERRVLHRNISPDHIVWNPVSGEVCFVSFGRATIGVQGERPSQIWDNSQWALPFISPEQTGRINRTMDTRSDLYSLGATLYFVFTQEVPFPSDDPLEIVHSHLAKVPRKMHELDATIPPILSDVVHRLLAKNPEDRYQTADGLWCDLEHLLNLIQSGRTDESFPIGAHDLQAQLNLPKKLYGRDQVTAKIHGFLERVSPGSMQVLLVAGPSGIGKSSLIHSVLGQMAAERGYLGHAKFEQRGSDTPYEGFFKAISSIIGQIMGENDTTASAWKARILSSLEGYGQLLVDVFPDLGVLLGPQPSVSVLPEADAQQRFLNVFARFAAALGAGDRQTVIFFDDVQWADQASFRLLEALLQESRRKGLLFICALRTDEEDHQALMADFRRSLEERHIRYDVMTLAPLFFAEITDLLRDTFVPRTKSEALILESIAHLCLEKAYGNPFFIGQILHYLVEKKIFYRNLSTGSWVWDQKNLGLTLVSDNVGDFMRHKIELLDERLVRLLQIAALLGGEFDSQILGLVSRESLSAIEASLTHAEREEIIVKGGESHLRDSHALKLNNATAPRYVFLHDRLEKAFYDSIQVSALPSLHLMIGRQLLHASNPEYVQEHIFKVIAHFHHGISCMQDLAERRMVAAHCLSGVHAAKIAAAFESVFRVANFGIELLGEKAWQSDYDLMFALMEERTVSASLIGRMDVMGQGLEEMAANVHLPQELAKVYEVKIKSLMNQGRFGEAVDFGLNYARKIGFNLSKNPSLIRVGLELGYTILALSRLDIDRIEASAICHDQKVKAAHRVLAATITPAYFTNIFVALLINLKILRLSIKYGNDTLSPLAYMQYGVILAGFCGFFRAGLGWSELALKLVKKDEFQEASPRTKFYFNALMRHFFEPLRESIEPLRDAHRELMLRGNAQDAHISLAVSSVHKIMVGDSLSAILADLDVNKKSAEELQQSVTFLLYSANMQICLNLMGKGQSKATMAGPLIDFNTTLPQLLRGCDSTNIAGLIVWESYLAFLFGNVVRAHELLEQCRPYTQSLTGTIIANFYTFLRALTALDLAQGASFGQRAILLSVAWRNIRVLGRSARQSPANFAHFYELMRGEWYRVRGKHQKASLHFQNAIRFCEIHEYTPWEALTNERYAHFWLGFGDVHCAQYFLSRARDLYQQWGATAKVEDMEEKYASLLGQVTSDSVIPDPENKTTDKGPDSGLDALTLIRASQALSRTMKLDELLRDLMSITMENAGATRGVLAIFEGESLLIKVEGTLQSEIQVEARNIPLNLSLNIPLQVVQYVLRTMQTLVLEDVSVDPMFSRDPYIQRHKPKALICQPIVDKGSLIGIMCLENQLTARAFTRDRVALLGVLAAQGAISIKNVAFVEQVAEKARLEEQVHAAKAVQLALLPSKPAPPEVSIATHYKSADSIGGDWLSYELDPKSGRLFVCVGDVTGHGIPSALVTAAVAGAVKATIMAFSFDKDQRPMDEALLAVALSANRTVLDTGDRVQRNMTMAFVVIDLTSGMCAFINAGHPPILHVSQGIIRNLIAPSPLLGFDAEPALVVKYFDLNVGDRLFLYTDGLIENRGVQGERFKKSHVKQLLLQEETPTAVRDAVLARLDMVLQGAHPKDDATFLILRWEKPLTPPREHLPPGSHDQGWIRGPVLKSS